MKQILLSRISDDGTQTLGTLSFKQDNGQVFLCKTLELPFKNNQHQISCIPVGSYQCLYTKSPRFSERAGHPVFTYELQHVPNRDAIRIHSANFFSDLLGCIALGGALQDINADGEPDIINSRNTVHAFETEMHKQEFTLVIQNMPAN